MATIYWRMTELRLAVDPSNGIGLTISRDHDSQQRSPKRTGRKHQVNTSWTDLSGTECIPWETSRQHVDRQLPRERGRSYMRIGKIFTLEERIVTTAITDWWIAVEGGSLRF